MATANVQLMHECSPENFRLGTARLKYDEETEAEGKQKSENGKKYNGQRINIVTTA